MTVAGEAQASQRRSAFPADDRRAAGQRHSTSTRVASAPGHAAECIGPQLPQPPAHRCLSLDRPPRVARFAIREGARNTARPPAGHGLRRALGPHPLRPEGPLFLGVQTCPSPPAPRGGCGVVSSGPSAWRARGVYGRGLCAFARRRGGLEPGLTRGATARTSSPRDFQHPWVFLSYSLLTLSLKHCGSGVCFKELLKIVIM